MSREGNEEREEVLEWADGRRTGARLGYDRCGVATSVNRVGGRGGW